jgi:hypothetical protein
MKQYPRLTVERKIRDRDGSAMFPEEPFTYKDMINYIKEEYEAYDYPEYKFNVEYYGYDGGFEIVVSKMEPETDKEYNDRVAKLIAKEKKAQAIKEGKEKKASERLLATEEQERALLAELKAKYE